MALIGSETVNPRHLREKYKDWEGKRVIVGLSTYHYLCGTWLRTDEKNDVVFQIGEHEMRVPIATVATVGAANPVQSDFYK
jgi:hypothetical protein